jgi:hypothetical protein
MLAYLDTLIGFAIVMLGASLIIMLLTQGISAAGSFRGSSLRWGLRELFKHIDSRNLPTIAAQADAVAQQVLTHNLASDSIFKSLPWIGKLVPDSWAQRFQLATAIRPDELVGILRQLAEDPSLGALGTEINQLLDRPNPVAERQIRLMTETSAALKALALDRAPALIAETVKTVRESAGYLEAGFNMSMDRVSQQFATYVRIWTIILAFALAAGTGLDALKLVNDLYSKGDFRAALVGPGRPIGSGCSGQRDGRSVHGCRQQGSGECQHPAWRQAAGDQDARRGRSLDPPERAGRRTAKYGDQCVSRSGRSGAQRIHADPRRER